MQNPLDYTMENIAYISDNGQSDLSNITMTKGNVAHAVIQHLFYIPGDTQSGHAAAIKARVNAKYKEVFNKMVETKGAILLLQENAIERRQLFEQLRGCIDHLIDIIDKNDLHVVVCEKQLDGNTFGYETPSLSSGSTHSDLHRETTSIFHIFQDNLRLKHSREVFNYTVAPVSADLSCAGRLAEGSSVVLRISDSNATTSAEIQTDYSTREYYEKNILEGSGGLAALCDGRSLADGGINQGRMFMMEDGSVFTYDPAQAYCFESNPCYGYIDINGPEGPNRLISCSKGADSFISSYSKNSDAGNMMGQCTVNWKDVTDIYPVLFYNQVVKPASWAAKSVYFQLKSNQIGEPQIPSAPSGGGE